MSRIVTLRLPDETYEQFRTLAEWENRPLSNFIETAALRYVETEQFVDEFEMEEIRGNAGSEIPWAAASARASATRCMP
jgi:predicted transcriptional regulator